MRKVDLVLGILCFLIAAAIFVFGDGPRVVYSGIFFTILGIIITTRARRQAKNKDA